MPWETDPQTGEEWYEGGQLQRALGQSDPEAIVRVEVFFDHADDYAEGETEGGWIPFFDHGIAVETLSRLLRREGGAAAYFTQSAQEDRGFVDAEGPSRYRLLFLDWYVPHQDRQGKKH